MNGENAKATSYQPSGSQSDEFLAEARVEDVPTLDEAAFIRRAERRSVRRTVRVSLTVVLATLALLVVGWFGWRTAIDWQSQRILDYYQFLARMTMANNEVSGGLVQRGFPGASITLSAYRRIDGAILPAGEIRVHFYPWGGESFTSPEHIGDIIGGRLMLVPGTTPDLLFLEPPVGGGDASMVRAAGPDDAFMHMFASARDTSIAKLQATPPSATVEVAVSFDDVMTLEALQQRLGGELRLAWGALRVGSAGESVDSRGVAHKAGTTWWPVFPGSADAMGFAFDPNGVESAGESPAESEARQLKDLAGLARRVPGRWGRQLRKHSDYLERNGAKYFGAVVLGPPEAALALAESPDVSTVTLGGIVLPWQ